MRSIAANFSHRLRHGKLPARALALLLPALAIVWLPACAHRQPRARVSTGTTTAPVAPTLHTFDTVVVDAGHGGHDFGTRSSRLIMEKDGALDVAMRLNSKLRAAG